MSDEFGTVSVKRGDRAREIEILRQHYRRHREALINMISEAPTEILATEYRRLVHDIEHALIKLDEVEGRSTGTGTTPVPPPPHPARPEQDVSLRTKTEPGLRQLVTAAPVDEELGSGSYPLSDDSDSRSRLLLIVGAAVLALALIGWLIWRASSDRKPEVVREGTATTATNVAEERPITPVPPPSESLLLVAPALHDYGVIRKGTRATRQFEIVNNSEEPISVEVARSACRCFYYEHAPVIPPKAKESLTVTIDGARAKAGPLRETIRVTAKSDPAVNTSFEVGATIR